MIIDNFSNSDQYTALHPLFAKAFDIIKSQNPIARELGKTEIDGDKLIIIVSDSTMKTPKDGKLEVHNDYIDIQVPVSKIETFGWSPRSACHDEHAPFDSERDIQFFRESPEMYFDLKPGEFAIFFPGDAHAPCLGEDTIRKIIFKVKVS